MNRAAITLVVFSIAAGACSEGEPATTSTTAAATTSTLSVQTTTTAAAEVTTATTQPDPTTAVIEVPTTEYVFGLPEGVSDPVDRRSLVDLLELVPDTDDHRAYVGIGDFDLARRQLGLPALSGDETREELFAEGDGWFVAPFEGLMGQSGGGMAVDDWRTEFGFALPEVQQEIAAGTKPHITSWYLGTMTDDAIDDAVRSNPVWSPDVSVEVRPDATIYDWGGSAAYLRRRSEARPSGEAGLLAITEDAVIRADSEARIQAALDPSQQSLAEFGPFVGTAERLDLVNAVWVELTTEVYPPPRLGLVGAEVPALIEPWQALGVGVSVGPGGGGSGFVVLMYETETAAIDTAERLFYNLTRADDSRGRPYADRYPGFSIGLDGGAVIVRIPADNWRRIALALWGLRSGDDWLLVVDE